MKNKIYTFIISFVFVLALGSCATSNQGGTGISNPPSSSASVASALSSVFGSSDSALLNNQSALSKLALNMLFMNYKKAHASGFLTGICDTLDTNPTGITKSASVTPGSYGTTENSVSLTAENGCDNGGDYASFTLSTHDFSCSTSTASFTLTMTNSSGVTTQNIELNQNIIYGSFNLSTDGGTTNSAYNCYIVITVQDTSENPSASETFTGQCEDSDGNTVDQSSDITCN